MNTFNKDAIEQKAIQKLKTMQDLELPTSIYDLGLIYKTEATLDTNKIHLAIEMTTINSRCNGTKSLTDEIVSNITSIDEIDTCTVKFVFSPKWELSMISEDGLSQLRSADANK